MSTHALRPLHRAMILAMNGVPDDDAYWKAIARVQSCAFADVWHLVEPLSRDEEAQLRMLVPDILRYVNRPDSSSIAMTLSLFRKMLATEFDPAVISSIGFAFVDLSDCDERVELMLPYRAHVDQRVRSSVVHALLASTDARAIEALIELSRDVDADVRDWATFGLGSQIETDSVEIRDALAARLTDPHEATRDEALVGLAHRRDPRAHAILLNELQRGSWSMPICEAVLAVPSTEFRARLLALAQSATAADGLAEAIEACERSVH